MAIFFNVNITGPIWLIGLVFGFVGLAGLFGIIAEILKLPISRALIEALNAKLAPGKAPINPSKLNVYQQISYRLQTATGNVKIIPAAALVASLLTGIVAVGVVAFGGDVALINTTITGRWAHEMDSVPNESTWIMNITMWQMDGSEPGTLYMNVSDNGTFDLEYNSASIVSGTWTDEGEEFKFLHHDPDGILMSLYENYRIRGNYLYIYGGQYNYFEKV